MKGLAGAPLAALLLAPAAAEVPSVLGGKLVPAGSTAHHVGAGVPGIFYEWRRGGWDYDWGVHGGLVYEDWSGAWSDVDAGIDLEVPIRYRLGGSEDADLAFRLTPGALLADAGSTVLGIRADAGVPVSVDVHPRANLVTGATVPFTVLVAEEADPLLLLPVLARLGLESFASSETAVFLLLELGPVFRLTGEGDRAKLGSRFWAGVTFYM